jgi:hypothetical protein
MGHEVFSAFSFVVYQQLTKRHSLKCFLVVHLRLPFRHFPLVTLMRDFSWLRLELITRGLRPEDISGHDILKVVVEDPTRKPRSMWSKRSIVTGK